MKFTEYLIVLLILIFLGLTLAILPQVILNLAALINIGKGEYTGSIVETTEHGIFFTTKAVYLKTGENSSMVEGFCVMDKDLFEKIKTLSPQSKVTISYNKKLGTPSWQCAFQDSSDIITDIKLIEDKKCTE